MLCGRWQLRRREKARLYQAFFLDICGAIPWEELPNLGLFAVEVFPSPGGPFRIVKGMEELRKTLELYASKGMLPEPSRVFVLTAAREQDFPDRAYEQLVKEVHWGIEQVKKRGDRDTLREIRSALERKGKRPGVAANPENNRWMIDLLTELASGKQLKGAVPRPWKPASASARLSRFCWDFYTWCTLFGAHDRQAWQEPYIARVLRQEFGFRFLDEGQAGRDLSAANEAYRRGKQQAPKPASELGKLAWIRFDKTR
jgi:hypothetical protein